MDRSAPRRLAALGAGLLLAGPTAAAPRPADLPRVSPALRGPRAGERAVVEAPGLSAAELTEKLESAGIPVEAAAEGLASVRIDDAALRRLDGLPGVRRVRPPWPVRPKGGPPGAVRTAAWEALFADGAWRERGRGARVAVVDVGFSGVEDLLGAELPRAVRTRFASGVQASAHGTAVAEVVADVAPAAELWLVQVRDEVDLLAAIDWLGDEDVDVVNASIGLDNTWPADGSSPVSAAVAELVATRGVVWVNAAGNENRRYRSGPLTDADGDGRLEIGGVEGVPVEAPGGRAELSFRWSEPMDAATTDIDLVLLEADGGECARSAEPQDGPGSSPYEALAADCASHEPVAVPVLAEGAALPEGLEGWLYAAGGVAEDLATHRGNLTLPADAVGALAVGACDPWTGELEPYSSRGPTEDGRLRPDLCAAGLAATASLGADGFTGTSASAPHVAGLAALFLAGPFPEAEATTTALRDRAAEAGPEGVDTGAGWGDARAGPPPAGCAALPGGPFPGWFALLLAARRRRAR